MWMEMIGWSDRTSMRNEVLKRVKIEDNILQTIKEWRLTLLVRSGVGTAL